MQKRSLFNMVFGRNPTPQDKVVETLKALSGYTPTFTRFGNDAYKSNVVRSSIHAIASSTAKLKPKVIKRVNGVLQTATDPRLDYILETRPNPMMSGYDLRYKLVTHTLLENNGYQYVQTDAMNNVIAIWPVPASTVEVLEISGEIFVRFRFMNGKSIVVSYEDVIHVRRHFNEDDFFGDESRAPIIAVTNLLHTLYEGIQNGIKWLATVRGFLKFNQVIKPEDMTKNVDDFSERFFSNANNGKFASTDSKFDFVEVKSQPAIIDEKTLAFARDEIYRYYNVSEAIVKGDFTETQWDAFYESVVEPIAIQLSMEYTEKVFSRNERTRGKEVIFEANRLQYASVKTKVQLVQEAIPMSLLTINEGREIFNLAPVVGGDIRLLSLNYIDAEKASEYQLNKAKGKGDVNGTAATDPVV